MSYSSNSLPTLNKIKDIVEINKRTINVKKVNYTYSFGTQKKRKEMKNSVQEYIILIE
jgi:DNA adenine methylase